MTVEENKALIRRYYEEIDAAAREKRDASFLDEFVSSDYANHNPPPGFTPDLEGLKQAYADFREASPDGYHPIEDMIADGDKLDQGYPQAAFYYLN